MTNMLSPRVGRGIVAPASSEPKLKMNNIDASGSTADDGAFDIDLEDVSKTRHRGYSQSDAYGASVWVSHTEMASFVAGMIAMALVLDPPFVLYFIALAVTTVALTVRKQSKLLAQVGAQSLRSWVVTGCGILVAGYLLQILQQFEIEHIVVDFELPALTLNKTQPSVTFFRMYNPNLAYTDDIEAIHGHLNNGTVSTQRLEIDPSIDVWASDVFRYEFLRRVWQPSADSRSYRVLCIAESDVVYDEEYITAQLLRTEQLLTDGEPREPLELAHVQHFWGHRIFEPFSIALLCTSSHASQSTQRWAQVASFLHRKRYRRLLPLDLLYALVPKRVVLYWDAHQGCTEYNARCKYIHFTQPKLTAIVDALHKVQQEIGAKNA